MKLTLQQRLGFNADDRLLILHADDIGMCEATVSAWHELVEFGLLTSASAMAPCPWFPATARLARELGERADLGLHLTLNCEWENYRWGPLTGSVRDNGLTDASGYFHSRAKATLEHVQLDQIRLELEEQIARAKQTGFDITHFDSHMLTLWHPVLMPLFLDLSVEHKQPALLVRHTAQQIANECVISLEAATLIETQHKTAEATGEAILIDSWHLLPFGHHTDLPERLQWTCDLLDTLEPGVHCIIGHPANDTPELRAIASDYATRIGDRELFGSEQFRHAITERGFKLIGFREIRNLFLADLS